MDCPCPNGTDGKKPCPNCLGNGMRWEDRGGQLMWVTDTYCIGSGRVQCDVCGGSGRVPC
jgi:DnaJ-class molecular chaperone